MHADEEASFSFLESYLVDPLDSEQQELPVSDGKQARGVMPIPAVLPHATKVKNPDKLKLDLDL